MRPTQRAGRAVGERVGAALLLLLSGFLGVATGTRSQEPPGGLRLADAVELALANDPNIALVRSRVDTSRGSLLTASGRFDPVVGMELSRSEDRGPVGVGDELVIAGGLGLTQQLRTGLFVEPALELSRVDPTETLAVNEATVSFALRQPLLRGRGRAVVAAAERSATEELEASRLDLQHAISARLASVITRYWEVVAASLDLEVLQSTEESSRDLLASTRRLIGADVTPAADAVQIEADLAAREADRIAGEQALFAARQALGQELGLPAAEIAGLPMPSDPLPRVDPERVPAAEAAVLELTREALDRRADLHAARARLASSETFLVAARNTVLPQVDLVFVPSYTGRVAGEGADDFLSPVFRDLPGLSTVLGLSFSWPVRNRRAEGALIEAEAGVRQAELEVERITKEIAAQTPTALDAVRRSALQMDRAAEALRLFEVAVENEERKLQAGTSTLLDLISQRDRLIAARRRLVGAQLGLALALVDLRFQTGTLVTSSGGTGTLVVEDLAAIPTGDRP